MHPAHTQAYKNRLVVCLCFIRYEEEAKILFNDTCLQLFCSQPYRMTRPFSLYTPFGNQMWLFDEQSGNLLKFKPSIF